MITTKAEMLDRLYTKPKVVLRKNSYLDHCFQKQRSYIDKNMNQELQRKISVGNTRRIFERDLAYSRKSPEEREFKDRARKNSQENLARAIGRASQFVFAVDSEEHGDEAGDKLPPLFSEVRKGAVEKLDTMDTRAKVTKFISKLDDAENKIAMKRKMHRSLSVPCKPGSTAAGVAKEKDAARPTRATTPRPLNRTRSNSAPFLSSPHQQALNKVDYQDENLVSDVTYRVKQYKALGVSFDVTLRRDSLPGVHQPLRRPSVEMKKTYKVNME